MMKAVRKSLECQCKNKAINSKQNNSDVMHLEKWFQLRSARGLTDVCFLRILPVGGGDERVESLHHGLPYRPRQDIHQQGQQSGVCALLWIKPTTRSLSCLHNIYSSRVKLIYNITHIIALNLLYMTSLCT